MVLPIVEMFIKNKKNVLLRVVTFIYRLIFGVFFYQYQIICVAEIAMIDYERIPDPQFRAGFFASLFLSMVLLVVMVLDILDNFMIARKLRKSKTEDKEPAKPKPEENMSMNNRFTLDRFTRILNLDESSYSSYY